MDQLPNEIHRKILCLLTPAQMIRLSETCKTINQLNFSRYMIPLGLEGVYTIYDNITAEERRHLHNLIYDSYLNIYELFGIDPFISYCKDKCQKTDFQEIIIFPLLRIHKDPPLFVNESICFLVSTTYICHISRL